MNCDNGDPPLHPNCRCVIIPVVKLGDEGGDTQEIDADNEGGFITLTVTPSQTVKRRIDWQRTYHGSGGRTMTQTPMLGNAFYVSQN
jgi:hypothetical protein